MKVERTLTWDIRLKENPSFIYIEEYMEAIKEYGEKTSKTVRSSRRFLRSVGLNIDNRGNIISSNKKL